MFHLILTGLLMVWSPLIWGGEITYGAEFEFTSDWMHETAGRRGSSLRGNEGVAAARLAGEVMAKCLRLGCKVTPHHGKWTNEDRKATPEYLVRFREGFWMNISYDPLCVEIQSKPMTQDEWKRFAPLIQETIFNSAKNLGYEPLESRAGHFNIGALSAFGSNSNVKDFLRFFVDYANHAELASGVLRKNWSTAVPLILQSEVGIEALKVLIEWVERGRITTIDQAANFIQAKVYVTHPQPERYSVTHNQALNVTKLLDLSKDDAPMEIRAIRAQKTVYEFIQLIEIFEGRIEFLKRQKGPIVLDLPTLDRLGQNEALSRFERYLGESGLKSQSYSNLLPTQWPSLNAGSSSGIQCRQIF